MIRRFAALLLLVLQGATLPALAAGPELELDGEAVQGGMVSGRVAPGSKVALDGKPLPVSPEGVIAFGFGRDAPPQSVLTVTAPDGTQAQRQLTVARRSFAVQHVDGLPPRMVTPPPEVLERIRRDNARVAAARRTLSERPLFLEPWRWPVEGPISGVYGSQRILNGKPSRPHYGVDVAVPTGTPVRAPVPGTVTLADDLYFSGWTVILDHGLGISTVYMHLAEISVAEGQQVDAGAVLGTVGATGRATGPHLHWGMNWFQERLDPALRVGPMPVSQGRRSP